MKGKIAMLSKEEQEGINTIKSRVKLAYEQNKVTKEVLDDQYLLTIVNCLIAELQTKDVKINRLQIEEEVRRFAECFPLV
jgi:hypothetical protein